MVFSFTVVQKIGVGNGLRGKTVSSIMNMVRFICLLVIQVEISERQLEIQDWRAVEKLGQER